MKNLKKILKTLNFLSRCPPHNDLKNLDLFQPKHCKISCFCFQEERDFKEITSIKIILAFLIIIKIIHACFRVFENYKAMKMKIKCVLNLNNQNLPPLTFLYTSFYTFIKHPYTFSQWDFPVCETLGF